MLWTSCALSQLPLHPCESSLTFIFPLATTTFISLKSEQTCEQRAQPATPSSSRRRRPSPPRPSSQGSDAHPPRARPSLLSHRPSGSIEVGVAVESEWRGVRPYQRARALVQRRESRPSCQRRLRFKSPGRKALSMYDSHPVLVSLVGSNKFVQSVCLESFKSVPSASSGFWRAVEVHLTGRTIRNRLDVLQNEAQHFGAFPSQQRHVQNIGPSYIQQQMRRSSKRVTLCTMASPQTRAHTATKSPEWMSQRDDRFVPVVVARR